MVRVIFASLLCTVVQSCDRPTGVGPATRSSATMQASDLEARCRKNLRALFFTVQEYSATRNGALPAKIEDAIADQDTAASTFYHDVYSGSLEYAYIDWSAHFKLSELREKKLPLLFDNRMGRHATKGLNVLLSDGSVFWDADGKWLKQFKASHPEVTITIPEEQ